MSGHDYRVCPKCGGSYRPPYGCCLPPSRPRKPGRPALSPEGKRRRCGPFSLPPDVARRLDDETNKSAAVAEGLMLLWAQRGETRCRKPSE